MRHLPAFSVVVCLCACSEPPPAIDVGEGEGETDTEPLGLIDDEYEVFDNTCSDHRYRQSDETDDDGAYVDPCEHCHSTDDENGIMTFAAWLLCQGCGSHLGGPRYRLSLWKEES